MGKKEGGIPLTEIRRFLFLKGLLVSSIHGNALCPMGFIDSLPMSLVLGTAQMVDGKFGMIHLCQKHSL